MAKTSNLASGRIERKAGYTRIIWEAMLPRLVELVDEFRAWPIAPRSDQHLAPVQSHIKW